MVKPNPEQIARQKKKAQDESTIQVMLAEITHIGSSFHNDKLFEIAVGRWKTSKQQTRAAQKDIAEAEQRLADVKRRYGK